MQGYLSLVLHAHLPFVRHPEHERFLEEHWLFEAMTETYVPLLQMLEGWAKDGMRAPLTITLSPTLCTMLMDPLLQSRFRAYLDRLVDLAQMEIQRTRWEPAVNDLARFYLQRFELVREFYHACGGDLLGRFRRLQDDDRLEIITCAATHAVLPLLVDHLPSVRAQIRVACDHYRSCFGRDPQGIWLPECAYAPSIEPILRSANLRWFVTETHGVLGANPRPRYGVFAPVLTANGLAVFGRDPNSAKQVWSRQEGYPGDARYRDFYRDIGFDLDLDYLRPYFPAQDNRAFTGIKYYRITGPGSSKALYERKAAIETADLHAGHFLKSRLQQVQSLAGIMDRPPILLCPYDAELFGHWWYEGIEFLNFFVRKAYFDQTAFRFVTPSSFLRQHPTHQLASPAASSWGEEGYWGVWLNETNEWIYPHLRMAQDRMTELVRRFGRLNAGEVKAAHAQQAGSGQNAFVDRALKQAARELLLAQASDWPFILRTGTSPGYSRQRVVDQLTRFSKLYDQIVHSQINEGSLSEIESLDPIFPELDYSYFA